MTLLTPLNAYRIPGVEVRQETQRLQEEVADILDVLVHQLGTHAVQRAWQRRLDIVSTGDITYYERWPRTVEEVFFELHCFYYHLLHHSVRRRPLKMRRQQDCERGVLSFVACDEFVG